MTRVLNPDPTRLSVGSIRISEGTALLVIDPPLTAPGPAGSAGSGSGDHHSVATYFVTRHAGAKEMGQAAAGLRQPSWGHYPKCPECTTSRTKREDRASSHLNYMLWGRIRAPDLLGFQAPWANGVQVGHRAALAKFEHALNPRAHPSSPASPPLRPAANQQRQASPPRYGNLTARVPSMFQLSSTSARADAIGS